MKTIKMKRLFHYDIADVLLALLIWSMLLAQTSFMSVKLVLIISIAFINLFKGKYKIGNFNPLIFTILLLILLRSIYLVSSAVLHETMTLTELLAKVPFLFIHPFLYYLLIPNFMGDTNIQKCCSILIIGHFLLLFHGIYNLYASFYGLPLLQTSEVGEETFNVTETSIGISSGGLYQMMLTLPVFFTMGYMGKLNKMIFIISAIITSSYVLVAGRVALIIILFMSILIPFIMKYLLRTEIFNIKIKKKYIGIAFLVVMIGFVRFSEGDIFQNGYEDFINHFDKSSDSRFEQREVFTRAWLDAPIWGHGYGKAYILKSKMHKQSDFESTYHVMLANTGIVGFGLYMWSVALIIIHVYKKSLREKNVYSLAMLIGYVCYLLADITNPSLASFDRLLCIYLCIGCIAEKKRQHMIKKTEDGIQTISIS